MTEPRTEQEREHDLDDIIREGEEFREEISKALPDITKRLDAISEELRRLGSFPIASQIERERLARVYPQRGGPRRAD